MRPFLVKSQAHAEFVKRVCVAYIHPPRDVLTCYKSVTVPLIALISLPRFARIAARKDMK